MSERPKMAVTEPRTFCDPEEEPVMAINAGVPISVALELASTLLGGATRMVMNGSDYPEDSTVTQHLLETTKALVDASLTGLWALEKGEPKGE